VEGEALQGKRPRIVEPVAAGTDGLTVRILDFQINCEAKIDGK
jgi:hypothetical protein